ncbi:DUF423 domain-containing protein [uncultured Shewanella sp.]|uniref:DUF423 domain-containing protein n=1 Tax=uncultured Shewanella sp. TaxID=173975 RepID=UPI00262A3EB1|nr:DUF423 domain-containing protein [uncultured Shewanella sp.]
MRSGFLLLAGLSGFLAVSLGAFGAHSLKDMASVDMIRIFNLGVEYQFYHTFALIAVAFASHWLPSRILSWAGYLFILGIVLFSGSLYVYALTQKAWLGAITPLGGLSFLLGWLFIAVAVWRNRVNEFK